MTTRFPDRIARPVVGLLGSLAIRLTRRLMRVHYVNAEALRHLRSEKKPILITFWHGRLFLMPYAYDGKKISILISQHRDGEYISRAMQAFGFSTTRGSTTSGGGLALRRMVRKFREGFDLAFTPDGPRGPRYRIQPGVIQAARLTGGAILPVSFSCTKKNSSGRGTASWCRFPSPGGTSAMGIRSAWTGMPTGPGWRKSGSSLNVASRN